jgi:hypothetical protein
VKALIAELRDISEDRFCAGWMHEVEFHVWESVQQWRDGYREEEEGGMGDGSPCVTKEQATALEVLSDLIGGWVFWAPGDKEPKFVTMSEFHRVHQNYETRRDEALD